MFIQSFLYIGIILVRKVVFLTTNGILDLILKIQYAFEINKYEIFLACYLQMMEVVHLPQ